MSDKNKTKKKGFWNMHFTTTISISLVLFLVGMLCMLLIGAHNFSNEIRENVRLSVILDGDANETAIRGVEDYLKKTPFCKSIEYISKEQAMKELVGSLGENPEDFLGYNPLLPSLEVKLNPDYANSDSIAVLEAKLKNREKINRVIYQRDLLDFVNENIKKIGLVLFVLSLVLLLISFVLINNTICLALHSDRFLISTMKLVGADSWFIRKPYIQRWAINGLIAALLAIIYIAIFLFYSKNEFGFEGLSVSYVTISFVVCIVIALGIFITSSSANYAIKKYIKMSTNEIYSL